TRLPNHVAVLVDTSESMRLAETPHAQARAARAAEWLTRSKSIFDRWRARHRLDFYTFGDRLAPTTLDALTQENAPPPRAEATRLREALASVRSRYDGRELGGVVVISDGIDNGRLGESS